MPDFEWVWDKCSFHSFRRSRKATTPCKVCKILTEKPTICTRVYSFFVYPTTHVSTACRSPHHKCPSMCRYIYPLLLTHTRLFWCPVSIHTTSARPCVGTMARDSVSGDTCVCYSIPNIISRRYIGGEGDIKRHSTRNCEHVKVIRAHCLLLLSFSTK